MEDKDIFTLIPFEIAKILIPDDYDGSYNNLESYFECNGQFTFFRSGLKREGDEIIVTRFDQCELNIKGLLKFSISEKSLTFCDQTVVTSSLPPNIYLDRLHTDFPSNVSSKGIESKTFIEFHSLLHWLIEEKLYQNLESEEEVAKFLTAVHRFKPSVFRIDNPCLDLVEQMIVKCFGQFGYSLLNIALERECNLDNLIIDVKKELALEQEINGRLWFDLDSLETHWSKYNLSKKDILHFAEIGKLELCIDWHHSQKINCDCYFQFNPKVTMAVSPLIQFCKTPSNINAIHSYLPSSEQTSLLERFVSISQEDISALIANGKIYHPRLVSNRMELVKAFSKKYDLSNSFTEDDLKITCRAIRSFEKNILKSDFHRDIEKLKNGMQIATTAGNNPIKHESKWLKILNEAVTHHYPMDRKIDPKRETVLEWLYERAEKEGIIPSENIVRAIFTIIKPDNHNPKKRKG